MEYEEPEYLLDDFCDLIESRASLETIQQFCVKNPIFTQTHIIDDCDFLFSFGQRKFLRLSISPGETQL